MPGPEHGRLTQCGVGTPVDNPGSDELFTTQFVPNPANHKVPIDPAEEL